MNNVFYYWCNNILLVNQIKVCYLQPTDNGTDSYCLINLLHDNTKRTCPKKFIQMAYISPSRITINTRKTWTQKVRKTFSVKSLGIKYKCQCWKTIITSLSKPYHFKFFKGCLPQISLGPFSYTLSHFYILSLCAEEMYHIKTIQWS